MPLFLCAGIMLSCSSSSSTDGGDIDVTPPPVPTGLTFENNNIHNGAAMLIWNTVTAGDLEGYRVYWLGGSPADLNANSITVDINRAYITGLDYETTYYFAVASVDRSGNVSALSSQISGKPLNTTSPLAPANVDIVAENIDFPRINVFWEPNGEPDIAYYSVYRSTTQTVLAESSYLVASVDSDSYIDINVSEGVRYYYMVTAVDRGDWESQASEKVSDYVLPAVELISPINFSYVGKKPTFDWEPVEGAIKYNIILTTSRIGGEIWNVSVNGDITELVYTGKTALISGNTYYWKIGAISREEINSISTTGSFVVSAQ